MTSTKQDIRNWLNRPRSKDIKYMIVACDTFNWDNYPIFCTENNFAEKYHSHNGVNMQTIDEVYDLSMDLEKQLSQKRAFNYPKNFNK